MANNNIKIDCTVGEFFANKNVFVTGGTGFLGTVLIEGLLSASPDIGTIYVLVRGKYGSDPMTRIERMLSKPIFAAHSPKVLKKVIPIVGELSEPNFGFSEIILDDLIANVNIIYHSAATINFNANLRTSIKTNIIGTLRTIELAKRVRNLAAYIYVSTAFCNCNNRGQIDERVYPTEYSPYEMMKLAESDEYLPDKTDPKLRDILKEQPNTYTFTKQLAENLITEELMGYPAGIVRPSVVYGTYKYPLEGWAGNANSGHLGFLAGYMKGIFRTMCGNPDSVLDIIPCDYVINSSLVMGWYVGTREIIEPEVIHCTSGEVNPLKFEELRTIFNETVKKNPCDKIVWKPYTKIRYSWRYTLAYYIFHLLPAYLFLLPERLFGLGKPQHSGVEYMKVFHKGTQAFDFFVTQDFKYSLKNSLRVMSQLNEKDLDRYSFDASQCNWSLLIERCFKGLRHYYFRESVETKAWHHIMWKVYEVLYYMGFITFFLISYAALSLILSPTVALSIATALFLFVVWL